MARVPRISVCSTCGNIARYFVAARSSTTESKELSPRNVDCNMLNMPAPTPSFQDLQSYYYTMLNYNCSSLSSASTEVVSNTLRSYPTPYVSSYTSQCFNRWNGNCLFFVGDTGRRGTVLEDDTDDVRREASTVIVLSWCCTRWYALTSMSARSVTYASLTAVKCRGMKL
jgi:hypothetical protein